MQTLISAILADDRSVAERALANEPSLATSLFVTQELYGEIAHWIYVGDTALHVAAAGFRVEICRMLLAAGADPSAAKSRRKGSPLHYAANGYIGHPSWDAERQVQSIECLLGAGADGGARDKNGATPLHRAVRARCLGAVICLLQAGSDPTIKNNTGSTAFHLAVQNTGRGGTGAAEAKEAQRGIIEHFLALGVKATLKDGKGRSVLDCAKSDWVRNLLGD